ncbi:hypothetical protein V6000_003508 [Aspergillus fumigatus]
MREDQRQHLQILVLPKAQQDFRKVVSADAISRSPSPFIKVEDLQVATSKHLAKLMNPRTSIWFVDCESFEV